MRISSVYPGFGLFDLTREGVPITIEKLRRYREIAWRLGCHLMIHPAGVSEGSDAPFDTKKAHIEALAEIMDAIASDKPGKVFKMAADVHFGASLQTIVDCTYFFERSKKNSVGLCLNMGHMTTSGQSGWELLEHFPQRIHVLAWKDHLLGPNLPQPVVSVELGKGQTPFKRYVEAYRKVECRGVHMVTFEDVPFEEKKDALRRSREYLTRLFQEG